MRIEASSKSTTIKSARCDCEGFVWYIHIHIHTIVLHHHLLDTITFPFSPLLGLPECYSCCDLTSQQSFGLYSSSNSLNLPSTKYQNRYNIKRSQAHLDTSVPNPLIPPLSPADRLDLNLYPLDTETTSSTFRFVKCTRFKVEDVEGLIYPCAQSGFISSVQSDGGMAGDRWELRYRSRRGGRRGN
jgi:hypothetical protein